MELNNNKGINPTKNIILTNIYAPNIRVPKFIKQILTDIKGKTDMNRIIVENFNT